MIDSPVAETRPSPRCTVAYEAESSTWSAFYGAIPLGRGFATVSSAWDEVDRMVASRVPLAPAAGVRPADAGEPAEASRDDDGGDPDRRPGPPSRYRGTRSPAAREHRRRRWRARRAPVSAAP